MNALEQLKHYTTVVVDTGDLDQIAKYAPQDATTNPSLILKAVQQPQYAHYLTQAVQAVGTSDLALTMDTLLVEVGFAILQKIPGRVSTEIDARLSYDTHATVARAQRIMALYQTKGIDSNRVLIKIAATWEGIQAAGILERMGIHTNVTLIFSLLQAWASAQSGVTLISPFVGRIYDWFKKQAGSAWDEAAHSGIQDPGVQSVATIYHGFKQFGYKTQIMGASFRNIGQILALNGCDLLTISPALLHDLANQEAVFCTPHPPPPPPPLE